MILVTGANGFVGRALVARLVRDDVRVRALVLPGERVPEAWAHQPVEVVRGDVTDAAGVARAAEGVAAIHHLAAVVGDHGDDALHQRVTVGGTRNALEAARLAQARLVIASSVVVYGDEIARGPCDEDTTWGTAQGPYSRAKQAQERVALEHAARYGTHVVRVRPANVYGPGSGPWLHDLARELRRGTPALIAADDADAGLVHVQSIAELFVLAAARAERGAVYNGCDELGVTWARYLADVARIAGARPPRRLPRALASALATGSEALWPRLRLSGRPVITREALNLVGSDNRFPSARAREELGWKPSLDYEAGLATMRRYVDEGGLEP